MTIGEIIPVQFYDYLIFPHDSKFKVKSGVDGTTVYETVDQTDALGAFQYCRDQMGLTGGLTQVKTFSTYYPFSDKLTYSTTSHYRHRWQGAGDDMGGRVRLLASNNTPLIEFDSESGAYSSTFDGFYLSHAQSGYTNSLVNIKNFAVELGFKNIYAYDSANYKGNVFGMELLDTTAPLPSQYKLKFENINVYGFENVFYVNNNVPVVGSNNSITSLIIDKVFAWNSKRVIKAIGASGAQFLAPHINNVIYQYTSANPLSAGEAIYDFDSSHATYLAKMNMCTTWDYPANTNAVNMGSSTELMSLNSNIARIGGSGAAKFKSLDYYNHAYGYFETNAVIGQRDYTITHGLGIIPDKVFCTIMNQDVNNQFYVNIPKSSITSTQFTARLSGYPVPGTNNLKFAWRVSY